MSRPKDVLRKWVEAFNTRDAEAAANLYHEDAHSVQLAFGTPLVGRRAILEDLRQFFEHNPDNETHPINLLEDGEWAVVEWKGTATFYASPGSEGKPFKLQGCGFFRIVDGKIREQRGYFDKATWFKQVGLPLE